MNNSASQKPHPLLTLQPDSLHPGGTKSIISGRLPALKTACEIKRHRPWRCILPREIAELQIMGRREQHDNNRLPRQDGWAETGVAYTRACTWHGQPGKARAGKGWDHAINTSLGRGEELFKLKDAAGVRTDGDKSAVDMERRGETLVCSPVGCSSAELSLSPLRAALRTPLAEPPPSPRPLWESSIQLLPPRSTLRGSQEQTLASHGAWIPCCGQGSVSLQPVVHG